MEKNTTRLSQRVCKRDFCSHVFANPDRYILRVNLFETSDNFLSSEFTVALSGLRFLLAYSILVSSAKRQKLNVSEQV